MKLAKLLILEGRFLDSPKEDTIFNDNGKNYYIAKISGDNITAHYYNQKDNNIIVLDKKKIKFSKSNLEMKGALDVITFEKNPYASVMDEKEWEDYVKDQKRQTRILTTKQYEEIVTAAMEDIRGDGYEEFTFDVAQKLAQDPKIRQYAKAEYGSNWMQQIQWDLESCI